MAEGRDGSHAKFVFVIEPDDRRRGRAPIGSFQECSNVGMEISIAEYRKAWDRRAAARALGEFRGGGDVTLKAGTLRSRTLRAWLEEDTGAETAARDRTLLIHFRDEHSPEAPLTWTLHGARIIKHVSGPLNAKGTDVAMEELTLAYERLEMEF
jgi:phage tail-like protein